MTSTTANRISVLFIATTLAAIVFTSPSFAAKDARNQWKKDWGPLVPHKSFPKDCNLCHVPKRWDVLKPDFQFDHLKETGYPLEGAHSRAMCLRCHNDRGPAKAYAARGCAGCHVDPHRNQMGFECKRCHSQDDWRPANAIAQHAQTPFPLTGMHAALQCEQCHQRASAGDFKGAPINCVSCHQDKFQQAPNHVAMHFPTTCLNCHTTVVWSSARFDHSGLGPNPVCMTCHQQDYQRATNHVSQNFPTTCQNCHNTNTWNGAVFNHSFLGPSPNCYSCHQPDYQRATNHAAKSYPTTCANCHNTVAWTGATFNHSFLGASPNCYSCHQPDFQRATNHVSQNYPTTCATCHNTVAWTGATFNHSFLGTNPNCYSCHQADYQRAANHVASNYPTACNQCHTTVTWLGATFNHTFPLTGNHNTTCAMCHPGGNTTTFTCLICHLQPKTDADHQGKSGYSYNSQACFRCHPTGR